VTQFFEEIEKSTNRLMVARKGRPFYPNLKEREEFLQRAMKLREEVNEFRVNHKIEYPPEYPAFKINDWIVTYKIQEKTNAE
jgi:hypothetical protein